MLFFNTCNCRERWIVDHCLRFVQEYVANGQWPEDNELGRHDSAHYEHESSSEAVDQDEPLRFIGIHIGRNGGQENGLNGQWDESYDGEMVSVRIDTWDGTPNTSFRNFPVKFQFHWIQRCQRCEIRDFAYDQYSTAHAVRHDHGYINNGSSDSVVFSGGAIDRGETEHGRRAASSSRRPRPRIINGSESF